MDKKKNFAEKISSWYNKHGRRSFPWRNTSDPYAILIAEMMLQKTHAVEQVLPVYKEFLRKYPNVQRLSGAEETEIKETICSLGLQNIRSRRFKEVGAKLKSEFNGRVPDEYNALVTLPGVGEYIANAVMCMAFNKKAVMVDANFGRVLGRIFYGKEEYPPSKSGTWKLAKDLISNTDCRHFNLGIIDMGAIICTPKSPKCELCPFDEVCIYSTQTKKAMTAQMPKK
jgi:A/G-specific adenine glycosylase